MVNRNVKKKIEAKNYIYGGIVMTVKCGDIIEYLQELAPLHLAEDWDNVGLIVGSRHKEVKRVMLCLDATLKVVEEAVECKADMIISHHPLIFRGLKKLNDDSIVGKRIIKLVQNNISIYSAHTNLDTCECGVNQKLAEALGLQNIRNLNTYNEDKVYKLVVFVPFSHVDAVRDAITGEGGGWTGNYSDCTFMTPGIGTFRPLEGTNPFIGSQGKLEKVDEYRLETVVPERKLKKVIDAMLKAHPYEEVAYDIYPLQISGEAFSIGKIGDVDKQVNLNEFVEIVKEKLDVRHVRVIGDYEGVIERVAVFCGSFDRDWVNLNSREFDILVTGDVKYHDALDIVESGRCVIDAGHFATERIILPVLKDMLSEKFENVEFILSNKLEDPFNVI